MLTPFQSVVVNVLYDGPIHVNNLQDRLMVDLNRSRRGVAGALGNCLIWLYEHNIAGTVSDSDVRWCLKMDIEGRQQRAVETKGST